MTKHEYHIVMDVEDRMYVLVVLKQRLGELNLQRIKGFLHPQHKELVELERIYHSLKDQHNA